MIQRRLAWPAVAVLAACSSPPARAAAARRTAAVHRPPPPAAARRPRPARARRADDLRRRVAEGRPRAGEDRLRGRQPGHDADASRPTRRRRSRPRSSRARRPTSSCRPTRRTRRSSSTAGSPAATPVVVRRQQADGHRADRQPGRRRRRPRDLAKPGLKVIAAGDEVPITKYATQLVANLAKEPGYPADFADAYAANVVSKEDNVKAVVAKIELGEGDAGIVYVTDADGLRQGHDRRRARLGQRPGDLRRRRRQGVPEPGRRLERSSTGSPGPTARRSSSSFGFLPPPRHDGGVRRRQPRARVGPRGRGEHGRASRRILGGGVPSARRGPARPVPRPAGRRPRRPVDRSTARWRRRSPTPGRPRRALPEPRRRPRSAWSITIAFGLPLAFVLARRTFRGKWLLEAIVDLPIVLPPAVAGLGLLLVFGRRGLLGAPLDALGISIPFTTFAVVLAQIVRVGAVLHPLGADRDRRRRPRPRGRRPRRRRVASATCSGAITVPLARRGAGRRPGDDLGAGARRVRRHDHVRRQRRGPDADAAAGRLLGVPGAATSTRRSRPRRSSCWPRSACSSPSASSTGAGSWTAAASTEAAARSERAGAETPVRRRAAIGTIEARTGDRPMSDDPRSDLKGTSYELFMLLLSLLAFANLVIVLSRARPPSRARSRS